MCPPAIAGAAAAISSMSASTMFAVSLGVSALSAGAKYMAQSAQANAQYEAQQENMNRTYDAAVKNMVQQTSDLHARESQAKASTALDLVQKQAAAARAEATARASSESAGVSFDSMMDDYERQYASYADTQMQQLGFDVEQMGRTREAIQSQAQSRVNGVPTTPIMQPSLLSTGASMLSSTFNAYDKFSVRDPLTGARTLN